MTPLFLCHANCCRSVLAKYLYEDLCHAPALSAGLSAGDRINDKAEKMLRYWGIDASNHQPTQLTRRLCDQADAIFVVGPSYAHRLLREYGEDLADKSYLFADPWTTPVTFGNGHYTVIDPSFDKRTVRELVQDFWWMRQQVEQIHRSLTHDGPSFVPLRDYLALCQTVNPDSH